VSRGSTEWDKNAGLLNRPTVLPIPPQLFIKKPFTILARSARVFSSPTLARLCAQADRPPESWGGGVLAASEYDIAPGSGRPAGGRGNWGKRMTDTGWKPRSETDEFIFAAVQRFMDELAGKDRNGARPGYRASGRKTNGSSLPPRGTKKADRISAVFSQTT